MSGPVLKYAVIARGHTILCSHQAEGVGANFDSVMSSILPNIPTTTNARTSYTSTNNVTFNVMVAGGLTYLCASDSEARQTQPFTFLQEIQKRFTNGHLSDRAMFASEGELNRDFAPVLASQMMKYSTSSGNDHVSALQAQVEDVKGVMTQNIEMILERGQRLEELMDRTADLEASASTFQKTARKVKKHMCCKNAKMTIILIIVSVVVIVVLILIILFATHVLPPSSSGGGSSGSGTTTTTLKP